MLILSIKSWIIPELDFFCSLRYAGKSFQWLNSLIPF